MPRGYRNHSRRRSGGPGGAGTCSSPGHSGGARPSTGARSGRPCRNCNHEESRSHDRACRHRHDGGQSVLDRGRGVGPFAGQTVVWVNTKSGVYHFAGTKNYGHTKAGAYMCETDATAAGDHASKDEKHP